MSTLLRKQTRMITYEIEAANVCDVTNGLEQGTYVCHERYDSPTWAVFHGTEVIGYLRPLEAVDVANEYEILPNCVEV